MAKPLRLLAGELTWKQARFVENYISNGGNSTAAYVAAGYSLAGARQGASRLLTNVDIIEAIERERLQTIVGFKREDHIRILVGMATATIDDFVPLLKDHRDRENYKGLGHLRYALESIEDTKDGARIRLCDRMAALSELSEILGFQNQNKTDDCDDLDSGITDAVAIIMKARKRA